MKALLVKQEVYDAIDVKDLLEKASESEKKKIEKRHMLIFS